MFRNESLDATHLAEFHQIEGVVADYGLGLGDLIGVITEFFSRVGAWSRSALRLCSTWKCGTLPWQNRVMCSESPIKPIVCACVVSLRHQGHQAEERIQPVHGAINGEHLDAGTTPAVVV